jgi:hypothetical protein
MGLYLSAQRRKSGKASYHAHWQGNTLAQVHARPMCVGSGTHQRQLPYAQFHRIRSRRGPKKAIIAIAASMLSAIYPYAQGRNDVSGPRREPLRFRQKTAWLSAWPTWEAPLSSRP